MNHHPFSLENKRGLILGVANEHSIAYGCAKALKQFGCRDIILTYKSPTTLTFMKPCADALGITQLIECNVDREGDLEKVFYHIANTWGSLDFVVHSIAFADSESLHGRVVDCSWKGFADSLHTSAFSFNECCKLAEPLMRKNGTIITMTYLGAERVVENYGIMGPIKACLQTSAMYIANEFAEKNVRIFPVSPGVIKTRAASGLRDLENLIDKNIANNCIKRSVTIEEVGQVVAFLISDLSTGMTGQPIYVDGGYSMKG